MRVMESIDKEKLFEQLGYAREAHDELDEHLVREGLTSRRGKRGLALEKQEQVKESFLRAFIRVCQRGDCKDAARRYSGRVVRALSQQYCQICQGKRNTREFERMLEAARRAGWRKICIVGGSSTYHKEIRDMSRGKLEFRLVDGTVRHAEAQARRNMSWADHCVVWGGTMLHHSVSNPYRGRNCSRLAIRGIGELFRHLRAMAEGEAASGGG